MGAPLNDLFFEVALLVPYLDEKLSALCVRLLNMFNHSSSDIFSSRGWIRCRFGRMMKENESRGCTGLRTVRESCRPAASQFIGQTR